MARSFWGWLTRCSQTTPPHCPLAKGGRAAVAQGGREAVAKGGRSAVVKGRCQPAVELLESRDLLSGFHPGYVILPHSGGGATPMGTSGPTGTTPAQIRQAYGFNQITFSNGAVT